MTTGIEREVKLVAPPTFRLPDLTAAANGAPAVTLPPQRLQATYYDTVDLRLIRWGVTVRYRTGEDGGAVWTVKVPAAAKGDGLRRRELNFKGRPNVVPDEVAALLRGFVRHAVIAPVAKLATRRHRAQVRDGAGHPLLEVADDVGSVLGDPSELERVMLGLLSNAIKFTQPGGVITIRAQREGGTARIAVIDTGLGIPEAELGEVFDPFFRSEIADRRAIPGTGLGLPIARTIVEQHGGSISCESEPGKGTAMTVTLPFAIQEQRPATRRVS